MLSFIKNLVNSLEDSYHYLMYLIEVEAYSTPRQKWNIKCNGTVNITLGRYEINYIDKQQNIQTHFFPTSCICNVNSITTPTSSNNDKNYVQNLPNNVTEDEMFFIFATLMFIWFTLAIVIILCILIITLIITYISFNSKSNSSSGSDEKHKKIQTLFNYDIERYALEACAPEIG